MSQCLLQTGLFAPRSASEALAVHWCIALSLVLLRQSTSITKLISAQVRHAALRDDQVHVHGLYADRQITRVVAEAELACSGCAPAVELQMVWTFGLCGRCITMWRLQSCVKHSKRYRSYAAEATSASRTLLNSRESWQPEQFHIQPYLEQQRLTTVAFCIQYLNLLLYWHCKAQAPT
jgi:hypothetical protein